MLGRAMQCSRHLVCNALERLGEIFDGDDVAAGVQSTSSIPPRPYYQFHRPLGHLI